HLAELEPDVAPADHEELFGDLGELERRRRVEETIAGDGETGEPGRRRAGRDDRVLEAHLLRLLALDPELARALEDRAAAAHVDALRFGDRREAAREPAHHALALPLAQRIERHAGLAEIHTELARPLGILDDRGDMEQGLGGDAAFEEAGAAEPLPRVDDDRLESQLGAAEGPRAAPGPAAHGGHVPPDDETPHPHAWILARRSDRVPPRRGRSDGCSRRAGSASSTGSARGARRAAPRSATCNSRVRGPDRR